MTMSLDQLKSLLAEDGVRYFVDPERPALLALFGGYHGSYQIVFDIDLEGAFLQFRTVHYAKCPATHEHIKAVLELLGSLNYSYRSTKFGWDPRDGEIVCYVDLWLEDATVTLQQLQANLGIMLRTIDKANFRLSGLLATGADPGEPAPPKPEGSGSGDFDTI